jgi:hypothetical protein
VTKFQIVYNKTWKWALLAMVATALMVFAISPALLASGHKCETISASAMGTSTQLGQLVEVQMEIYKFSTPEDRQFLIHASQKGQNQGLVDALAKMKDGKSVSLPTAGYCSAKHISIPDRRTTM